MLELVLTSSASTKSTIYLHVRAGAVSLWVVQGIYRRMTPCYRSYVHGRAGAMAHWPALQRWADPAYLLAVAGPRTVPVELGAHYLAPGWGQALMPFSAFVAAHLLAAPCPGSEPCPGSGLTAAESSAELGGQGEAQAGAASAAAAGLLHARSERTGGFAGAAAGSGLAGAAAAHCGGRGAAEAPGGAAQRGYLAQHDLFAQVRLTPKPWWRMCKRAVPRHCKG